MPDDNAPASRPAAQAAAPAPAATPAPGSTGPSAEARKRQRARLFGLLAGVVSVALVGYGAYYVLVASHFVETDNAYVGASVAQITPQVSGSILTVPVHETLPVKTGDVLVTIDPADAKIALAQAEADYARAQRRVKGYFAADTAADAAIGARAADINRAQADLQRARVDLQRRQGLAASGAVSADEITAAETELRTAEAAVAQAQANQKAAQAAAAQSHAVTENSSVETNPEVAAAKAALDTARLNLTRTVIRAPIDGVVAENHAQIGQRIQTGAVLMTVAPLQDAYVDANFKEGQLRKVHIGQPATLTADLYGKGVKYRGTVVGIGGGTGSAFAVIPAQNATGNWIKVIQRVPVRIALDPKELAEHPLRVGLSMTAKIDLGS